MELVLLGIFNFSQYSFIFLTSYREQCSFISLEETSFPVGVLGEPGCIATALFFDVAYRGLAFIHRQHHIVLTVELNGAA